MMTQASPIRPEVRAAAFQPSLRARGFSEIRDLRSAIWQCLGRHAYILPVLTLSLIVCAWFVTWGDWNFFRAEAFCGYYDAQARSFLHSRVDVPPAAIGFEAFIRDGKTYGYFGIAPALLRLPCILFSQTMDGRWSRCSMLAACVVNLLCAYRIVLLIRESEVKFTPRERVTYSLFILCAGIGSTNVFLLNRAYTYHEAIIWGGAFALLFTQSLLQYLRSPSVGILAATGCFSFMSLHSRANVGAGTLLALMVLTITLARRALRSFSLMRRGDGWGEGPVAPPHAQASRPSASPFLPNTGKRELLHAVFAGAMVTVIIASYFAVNFAKFRTFDGVPVKYYNLYIQNPQRMAITGGRQIHIENIPTGVATYFGFRGMRFGRAFPWIYMCQTPSAIGKPAIDIAGEFSSIPVSMPALAMLALAGVGAVLNGRSAGFGNARLPVITLFLGGAVVLATVGITERYLHDFYPFLIVAAAAGAIRVASVSTSRLIVPTLALLSVVSVATNCAFAIEDQRVVGWGVPRAKCEQWSQFQHSVDEWLDRAPIAPAKEN